MTHTFAKRVVTHASGRPQARRANAISVAAREAAYEVSRFDAGHGSLVVEETMRHAATEIAFARRACGLPEA